jgi:hypothetical protein
MGVLDSFRSLWAQKQQEPWQVPTRQLTSRRRLEPVHVNTDLGTVYWACRNALLEKRALPGRARLGYTVSPRSPSFRLLLAIEEALYETMKDEAIMGRPFTSQPIPEDYIFHHKVPSQPTVLNGNAVPE